MADPLMCSLSSRRAELVAWQEDLVRETRERRGPVLFYVWAGYRRPADGHDCSGHIVWWCDQVGVRLPRGRATADSMWRDLEATDAPRPGDLALYGTPAKATHVMIVLEEPAPGIFAVAGMSGGGSATTSIPKARASGAAHKRFETHRYRRDFLGFRRLPLEDGAAV